MGWEKIEHDSGMPIYMNTETKVCSFSKPYFLGTNSLKVSACYQFAVKINFVLFLIYLIFRTMKFQ